MKIRLRRKPDDAFDRLVSELQRETPGKRSVAAQSLARYGETAVDPLCAALQDPDRAVRDAAAKSLGEIGDPRAVGPLIDVLRNTFAWRRPWFQWIAGAGLVALAAIGEVLVWLGFVAVIVVLLAITLLLVKLEVTSGYGEIWGAGWETIKVVRNSFKISDFFGFRRRQNSYCLTIAEALLKIAENSPSPQLREALPDLGAVVGDFVQQDARTRDRARVVSERIAALTEKLRNLPAPASPPSADTSTLPRATTPTIETKTLPRTTTETQATKP